MMRKRVAESILLETPLCIRHESFLGRTAAVSSYSSQDGKVQRVVEGVCPFADQCASLDSPLKFLFLVLKCKSFQHLAISHPTVDIKCIRMHNTFLKTDILISQCARFMTLLPTWKEKRILECTIPWSNVYNYVKWQQSHSFIISLY